MIIKEPTTTGKVRVTFSMPAAIWADTIYLVGDFNNWDKTATPLRLGEQNWSVSLELEIDRAYQYRYLVNGSDWYNDWRADRYEPNEFGGDNSVVITSLQRENRVEPVGKREFAYDTAQKIAHNYGNRASVLAAMKHTV